MSMFRKLEAREIDCRVSQINEKGLTLLLYKDARCDMNILDETVGAMNWQRMHTRDNANCIVSIWDNDYKQWVSKEDTGTESNTEAEKGLASDSFKRACFNWGIGRELYTAPFIWVKAGEYSSYTGKNGKPQCSDSFSVKSIAYNDKDEISAIEIINNKTGKTVYTYGTKPAAKSTTYGAFSLDNPHLKCADCGDFIYVVSDKEGNAIPLDEFEQKSNQYFGRTLCRNCQKKAMKK